MARLWSDLQDSKTPCAFVASRILQVLRGLTAGSQVTTYGRSMSGVGIVKLGGTESFWFVMVDCAGVGSGCCHCPPDREGPRSQESALRRSQQMASHSEKILDDSVEGKKPLGLARRFELAHLPFPLASRLMRGFHAIVGVRFRVVSHVA